MAVDDKTPERSLAHPLPGRLSKPRSRGKTMVIDKGLGTYALEDLLETASPYIDYVKFGFGTSLLYPSNVLRQKIFLCRVHSVESCTGGTLAEIALWQNKFTEFLEWCVEAGFTTIEISDGTYPLTPKQRRTAIERAAKRCHVVSEVGKKLAEFPDAKEAAEQIRRDLDSGSSHVIIEGRESGENAGIYDVAGGFKTDVLDALTTHVSTAQLERIMWEAPKKHQQVTFIRKFGVNVNLGNIAPQDVIALESLRRGLRADTFAWMLESQ